VPVQQYTIISLETSPSNLKIEEVCTYKTLFTCLPNYMLSHTKKEYLDVVNYFYPLSTFLVKNTATFEYSTTTDLIPLPSILSHCNIVGGYQIPEHEG
jgi:hypothetical protein